MNSREEEFLKRLQATFRIEAEEHLHAMSNGLLELESNPEGAGPEVLESVYRDAHSLKGAARAVNITSVEGICQSLESVLSEWKRGHIQMSPALIDVLNRTLGVIAHTLDLPSTQRDSVGPEAYADVINALHQWEKGGPPAQIANEKERALLVAGSIEPEPETPFETVTGELPAEKSDEIAPVTEDLGHSANLRDSFAEPSNPYTSANGVVPAADESSNGQVDAYSTPPNPPTPPESPWPVTAPADEISIPRPGPLPSTPTQSSISPVPAAPKATERPAAAETIRIATAKLDSLLLQAEELLSAKQTLAQRATDLNEVQALVDLYERRWSKVAQELKDIKVDWHEPGTDGSGASAGTLDFQHWNRNFLRLLNTRLSNLSSSLEQDRRTLNSMVDALLDDMKQVLMMPFSSLFELFPRLVRDLSRSLDKEANLEIQGGEIEIDRRILEEMKDPLIHLIRNSIDHGLEPAAERLRRGKPPVGTLSLSVRSHDSGRVEIVVSDDGAGIDSDKVRDAAIEKGAISPEQAAELDDDQARMLIFQSEVSTSSIITDVSGRGLGMAIVRDKVEKMGGTISIATEVGQGTAFHIVLPLTLATFRGILVEVSQHQFIIPTANVERVLRFQRDAVKEVGGRKTVVVDGQSVSLVALQDVLELSPSDDNSQRVTVVVLGSGERRIAFQIDEVLDEQEVLVKGLGRQLVRVRNIAGATVLGSGRVVPILNVNDLLKSALRASRSAPTVTSLPPQGDSAQRSENSRPSILIAEDSITSRMLIKNILESAGYRVKTTVDGAEALAALKAEPFNLVVSDVEMPRMNGFELTEKIRSDKQNGNVPVILVTSLSSREHQERGMDAGANAYIVKSSFDQGNLLDAVRRLIVHSG